MMPQIDAPIHSYKNPQIYYQFPGNAISEKLKLDLKLENIFYLANETRCVDSDVNLGSSKKIFLIKTRIIFFQSLVAFLQTNYFFCLIVCLFVWEI